MSWMKSLGAAAVLMLVALSASAQTAPATLFQPKPAPESNAESVPATPERAGVTPEQFQRMHLPPNSMLANRPSRVSDGFAQFEAPIVLPGPPLHALELASGVVLASAAARIDERRWLLKSPIAIGAPFNFTVPAGSVFAGSVDEKGESRPCLVRKKNETYVPPSDEKGEIHPFLCLSKVDPSGRYAEARLYPYYTDRAQPRNLAIAAAQLDPIAAGTPHPYFGALLAVRRLRIVEVQNDAVTVALEMASDKQIEESGLRNPFAALTDFGIVKRVQLPVRDGGSATLAGITFIVHRTAAGWSVDPSGSFTDWAIVSPEGIRVTLGEYTVGPWPR